MQVKPWEFGWGVRGGTCCTFCSSPLAHVDGEIVCTGCGVVYGETQEAGEKGRLEPEDLGPLSLGSFMGPLNPRPGEGQGPRVEQPPYIKVVSDMGLRTRGRFAEYTVLSQIKRACESLGLSQLVMAEAYRKARGILKRRVEIGIPLSAVTAYSIICAVKTLGVNRIGVRDVMGAVRSQGYILKTSHVIKGYLLDGEANRPLHVSELFTLISERLWTQASMVDGLRSMGVKPELYRRQLVEHAKRILSLLPESCVTGRNPRAMAATILYAAEAKMAAAEGRKRLFTQKMVAQAAGVAEYTVREQFCEVVSPLLARHLQDERPRADQVLAQAVKAA